MGEKMGNMFSCVCGGFRMWLMRRTYQIRVAGPAQAGKTSLIKWLKHRQFLQLPPTEGLDVDRVDFQHTSLVMWDTRQHFEEMVRPHQLDIRGIIYIVDSADPGRLRIANRALERLLRDAADACVLVVFATKQDKPGSLSVSEIQHQLQLDQIVDKECGVFACSAKTGEGIEEGIEWMVRRLRQQDATVCTCPIDYSFPCYYQQPVN